MKNVTHPSFLRSFLSSRLSFSRSGGDVPLRSCDTGRDTITISDSLLKLESSKKKNESHILILFARDPFVVLLSA